jgi:hypothetical protein
MDLSPICDKLLNKGYRILQMKDIPTRYASWINEKAHVE